MTPRIVQCFASGHPNEWEGICVDFDIAVQGASLDEVQDRLREAVRTYVAAARSEDPTTAHRLLNRRAPFLVHLRLLASYLFHTLCRPRHDDTYRAGFDVPCPG